ncbi:MAG: hypothetical protein Q9163_004427 [Psora crenata]
MASNPPAPLELANVQGDILAGGLPKKTETFVFFQIDDARVHDFRTQLTKLVPMITTTAQVIDDRNRIAEHKKNRGGKDADPPLLEMAGVNIAFSHKGLAKMEITDDIGDTAFNAGMLADAQRLGDPGSTSSGSFNPDWIPAFKNDVHGVVIVSGDCRHRVAKQLRRIKDIFGAGTHNASIHEVLQLVGDVRPGKEKGHEHFGFLDGIVQPAVKGVDKNLHPGQEEVRQGIILLGREGDEPNVPDVTSRPPWALDGSFLAFRYLFQLVPEFNTFLKQNPIPSVPDPQLGSELLGARMVGRWKSGAPIDITPTQDDPALGADPSRNDKFRYDFPEDKATQDRCPFAAHTRKTNPRADLQDLGFPTEERRIIRSGIQFGPEVTEDEASSGKSQLARGLLFACYQSNIVKGFQFIQESWANEINFPIQKPVTPGFDPIIGQAADPTSRTMSGTNPSSQSSTLALPTQWIVTKGGEYFFSPSIPALKDTFAEDGSQILPQLFGNISLTSSGLRPTDSLAAKGTLEAFSQRYNLQLLSSLNRPYRQLPKDEIHILPLEVRNPLLASSALAPKLQSRGLSWVKSGTLPQRLARKMAPKQATLGKFFGNTNGVASKAQQSKLAFKTAGAPSVGEGEGVDDEVNGVPQTDADISAPKPPLSSEIKLENAMDGDKDACEALLSNGKPEDASSSPKSCSVSPSKRNKGEIEEDDDKEDEEPVKKRPRRHGPRYKKAHAGEDPLNMTKQPSKPGSEGLEVNEALKSSNKAKKKDKAANMKPQRSSKQSGRPEATDAPWPADADEVGSEHAEAKAASEVEEDVESEEDDEKPEAAAKAREKVQSTLKSSGKDPYPDWTPGEPVPYSALCTTFSLIELTTKRLVISAHCSLFLRQVLRLTPQDLLPTVQLMINKLAADYAGIELGIGESLIMKAIGETTGRSLQVIKDDQNQIGDLGLVAAKSRSNQPTMFKPKPLTVRGVLDGLMTIATVSGDGSQGRKIAGIKKLLSAADASAAGKGSKGIDITKDKGGPSEAKFIIRFLEGKLRLGLAEKTVLTALAHAMVMHETEKDNKVPSSDKLAEGESILKTVYSELPSYEVIIPAMVKHGVFQLRANCKLQPGVPLKPMLAKPTKSITEVLDRFEGKNFTCEYKYDGERAQIHYVAEDSPQQYPSSLPNGDKGLSAIFSRNSEDLSKKYPDILAKLRTWIKPETKSFVLDCETVAWDLVEKKVLPFQQLMTRKRKDVKVEDVKVKVCVFAFDMLFYNGQSIVQKSLRERREILVQAFTPIEGEFAFAQYGNTSELEEIQHLLDDSVKASCEGLMVKMLDTSDSGYEPSKRSRNWLKIKKDYLSGIGDSLDLVVLGAYYGKGKRTSVYGAFLLACYNSNNESYETVCNIGTGFSEVLLEELHSKLSPLTIDKPKPFYSHSPVPKDQPDVWFEPRFVWEVKTADLTLSPRYLAGKNELMDVSGRGISLRFPRFVKERDDKKPEQATGSKMVVEMYQKQEGIGKDKGPSVDDDFEY